MFNFVRGGWLRAGHARPLREIDPRIRGGAACPAHFQRLVGMTKVLCTYALALVTALLFASGAHAEKHHLPLFVSETSAGQEGVLRVINLSDEASAIVLHAIDDAGVWSAPATLTLGPRRAVELDARDLASGSASKNLAGGLGPLDGDRRLELDTDLPVQFLAYLRAPDGSLILLHDRVRRRAAPGGGFEHRIEAFNPARDMAQQSRLRLVNAGALPAAVSIAAHDDAGGAAVGGSVGLTLPAGVALSLTAQQLEAGDSRVTGQLGAGSGSWRLLVTSDQPIEVVNLVRASTGELANLSTAGIRGPAPEDHGAFGDRFADVMIEARSRGQARFFHLQAEDRFTETTDAAGSDARGGDYTYERTAANAGRMSQTFDDGEKCVVNVYFTSANDGWFASRCADAENGEVEWTGGTWSVADEGEPPPSNSSPVFRSADTPADQTYSVGAPIATLTLPAATGGDGTLTYTLTPVVPGLAFDSATRRLTGTPTATGTHAMTYTVTDGDGDAATLMFTITVRAAGGGTGGSDLGDCKVGLVVRPGESCTYPGTDDAFSVGEDGRGSFLVITSSHAINVNNANFQGRLFDFRASHQGDGAWRVDRLEGSSTPPSGGGGGGGGGGSDTSPAFAQGSAPGNQTYRVGVSIAPITLPAATGGDGELTYSLAPQVPGLNFDAATRRLTGTPTTAGTHAMTYSVTDADGDADSLAFTITVEADSEEPEVPRETDLLRTSGCGDGTYVDDPDDNTGLVGDCLALVDIANSFAAHTELPNSHVLRQWGAGEQEKLPDWTGIGVSSGRVTRISLRYSDLQGPIPRAFGQLTALQTLGLGINSLTGAIPAEFAGLTNLRSLNLYTNAVTDFSALSALEGLTYLNLTRNEINDISPVAGLTSLTTLYLGENLIEDITPLEDLTNLTRLGLSENGIEDLSPLAGLTSLTRLSLGRNRILDISVLAEFKDLTFLSLQYNRIEDISPLAGLTGLTELLLQGNRRIEDISSLAGLTNLTYVELGSTGIEDISPVASLMNLERFWAYQNAIVDVSPLAELTKLTELVLWRNEVTDTSALAGLTNLTVLGLDNNRVDDVSPLAGLNGLTTLWLGDNRVEDILPLAGLTNLTNLGLQNNLVGDISPLDGLTKLIRLRLGGNQIRDVSAITGLTNLAELLLADNLIENLAPLVSNAGLGDGDVIDVSGNPLSDESFDNHIPALKGRGVAVTFPLRLVDEFPNSRLTHVYNDNVMIMQVEEDVVSRDVLDALDVYATDFYHWFEDEFDYLMFLSLGDASENVDAFGYYGIYLSVMNDTKGIGSSEFFNSSYGSAGRLRGAIHFPYQHALRSGPALHELLHAWANFTVPTAVGAHWGFSSADGQLGGFNIDNLVDLGGDRWTAGDFGTFANGGNGVPYSPIELYLAGLIPREDVPDLWVAENGEWLVENDRLVRTEGGDPIFTAPDARTYNMADIVAEHGEREPAMVERPHQRAAVVLLVNETLPSEEDLQTLSEHATWLGMQGDDGSRLYNYYEATGGRATLSLDGLSTFRKDTPSAPTNLPTSFGEPPPPHATGLDGVCGPLEPISGPGRTAQAWAAHDTERDTHRHFSGLPGNEKYEDGRAITRDEFAE